jgi:N-methylhydantoinase B
MGHDGATGAATHLSNLHSTPIEVLESEFPCRIRQFSLVPDSGGAGRWRGGLAVQREYELLENAVVIRRFNKTRFPPAGVAGGKAGARARFVVRVGTDQEYETPASARVEMLAGERFLLQSAGGGGHGDPWERERTALSRDIAEGYVTRASAAKDYGSNE